MEKNIDEKRNSVAAIPADYVSILQLRERWMKEKERKQKEKDLVERAVKQQVDDEQRKRGGGGGGDLTKVVMAMKPKLKLEEKGLGGCSRIHFGVNRWKKEPTCVEKEKLEVSAKKDEDGGDSRKKNKNGLRNDVGLCRRSSNVNQRCRRRTSRRRFGKFARPRKRMLIRIRLL